MPNPICTPAAATLRPTLVALAAACAVCLVNLAPSAAHATSADEIAFNKRPRARTAMAMARSYLSQRRHGRAVNWANRAVNCADATPSIRAEATRMERDARWQLHDLGFGLVEVRVTPTTAELTVDGQQFRPASARFRIWLPGGSHQLEVRSTGYHDVRKIITAKAGEQRRLNIALVYAVRPIVRFKVAHVNAEVWLSKDFMGFTGGRAITLPVGKSLIEIRAPGYASWVRTLTLAAGEKRTIAVVLDRAIMRGHNRTTASNVRRELTPLERANRGERHRLGHRPGPTRERRKAYHGSGEAPNVATSEGPAWRKVVTAGGGQPSVHVPPPTRTEATGPSDTASSGGGEVGGGADGAVTATAFSSAAKGWMYTGIGVALVAAGVTGSVMGVGQAQTANGLSLGDAGYDSAYNDAANLTYAGYGAAGIGLASMFVGGLYLFAEDGLSRSGRGWFLVGTGLATGLAGAWLVTDAIATAKTANGLPIRHFSYDTNFDGAEANWRVGVVAAGVGGAVVLTGAWLLLTREGSAAAEADRDEPSWLARASFTPTFWAGSAGARLTLAW